MPLVRKPSGASPAPPSQSAASLASPDASERWSAARSLTAPSDVDVLGAALAHEHDGGVREAILTSLCRISTRESAAALLPSLRSDDAGIRRGALDALISIPQAAASHLSALLSDSDADVRLLSCEIVRALPSDEATRILSELLQTETVANVCTAAIDVLAEIGTPAALPALHNVAARYASESFLQFAIENARERISSVSANSRD